MPMAWFIKRGEENEAMDGANVVRLTDIEKQRMKYDCPSCSKVSVKRVAKGIWSCTKCHHTFAAKAYGIGE